MKKQTNLQTAITFNQWNDFYFKLGTPSTRHLGKPGIITSNIISLAVETFKELLLSNSKILNSLDTKLLILFKIKSENNQYRTISYMQTIDIIEIHKLKQIFIEYWNLRSEDYFIANYSDIVFTYKVVNTKIETKITKINEMGKPYNINHKQKDTKSDIKKITFKGFNLPATMDITNWGNCYFISDTKAIVYKKGSALEYHIELFDKYQLIDLKLNDKTLLSFKDEMIDISDLSTFTRTINQHEYIFESGELLVKKITKKVSYLTKVKLDMHNSKKFITMDLETRTIDGIMSSYCVSIYDGKIFKSFYFTNYTSEKEMLRASIIYLMKRKYNNYRVYLHNFSRFDAIFLLTVMTDLSDQVIPTLRDGQFINLAFKFEDKYILNFRDSLLLLPGNLRNLAINFGVENKGLFPYRFVNNKEISLDYIGELPNINYFDDISQAEYDLYCKEFDAKPWNLMTETIKYCELDCKVLYQIIDKFSNKIYKLFRKDLLKFATLSSLAFAIYRSNFLSENANIPLIQGEMYNFIKKSYTGGSVDVYKPSPALDSTGKPVKIKRYDVNSLYPYAMKKFPMPVGNPIYFEGDILKAYEINSSSDKPFGIFEVDIEAPLDIKIPLLQTRIKVNNGTFRTIAPIGTWTGHYFSDELYNAMKFGYKINVKRGYLFNKGNIFEDYVNFLYDLKENSKSGSPDYIISKLLLNSLYGRLGMNPISEQHQILSNEKAMELYSKIDVTNILNLKNGKVLISYFNTALDENKEDNDYDIKNISVVVSSVVTASARIHMSQFKTNNSFIIYYSDTDNIDIDGELDPKFIGKGLGLMKLEHIFNDAVYLAPKMYGGITENYEYVRIKGLKNPIGFKELKSLLSKDSKLEIKQEKWYSDISNGRFHIKDEIYTLMVTDNKRKLLYNSDNIFYDTLPIRLENNKIIES